MSLRCALLAPAAAIAVTAGSAFAADLPARTTAPAPRVAAVPLFTWTGFYVGLNAGGGWDQGGGGLSSNVPLANPVYAGDGGHHGGFTGGAQAGYNHQLDSLVVGVEADINYLDRRGSSSGVFPSAPAGPGTDFVVQRDGSSNNWFGTVRGRLGVAFDRTLIYATGGLAFGGNHGGSSVNQRNYSVSTIGTPASLPGSGGSSSHVGWALGAGAEYAFTHSISFRLEYMHISLGGNDSTSYTTQSGGTLNPAYAGGHVISVSDRNRFDIVRAGVNWRF